jgi:hypothetical protein
MAIYFRPLSCFTFFLASAVTTSKPHPKRLFPFRLLEYHLLKIEKIQENSTSFFISVLLGYPTNPPEKRFIPDAYTNPSIPPAS